MQRTKEVFSVVAMACAASVCYVSAIFLSKIIAYKSSVLSLIYMIAAGALYFLAMMSKDRKTVLIKWLISFFSGAGVWWWFIRCDYAVRALNWVFPDYGRPSAGGNLAGFFELLILSFLCLCGFISSLIIRPKHYERFRTVQIPVCLAFMVIIIAVVIILESRFPSAAYIYS